MATEALRETDLYPPIKRFLVKLGYEVKSEVGAADVMAVRGDEPIVIVELKTGFSLSLFHQAIERQAVTDDVYVAVPRGKGVAFLKALTNNRALCRKLGLGLITVRLSDGLVEVHAEPAPYRPRKSKQKAAGLLREFRKRHGDPNHGGSTRQKLMTAYRQDALRCMKMLLDHGPCKAAIVAKTAGVLRARRIMADNHYGWFERVETGIYGLTAAGVAASLTYAKDIETLSSVLAAAE
jgi:hypothetical protein